MRDLIQRFAGKSAKARNEQRKVLSNVMNAGSIGAFAGILLDSAQIDSKFTVGSAIYLGIVGSAFLMFSYILIGRMEDE